MKKIFALILVGIMLLGIAACGPKKDKNAATPAGGAKAPAGQTGKTNDQQTKDLLGE